MRFPVTGQQGHGHRIIQTTEQNILVNQFFLKYQDIFEAFEALDDYDKELIRGLIAQMKKIKNERY